MTVEHKLVVGLEDVTGLIFECENPKKPCKSRVRVPPNEGKIPAKCPNCDIDWVRYPLARMEVNGTIFTRFVELLAEVRKKQAEKITEQSAFPAFRILLEFDEPK